MLNFSRRKLESLSYLQRRASILGIVTLPRGVKAGGDEQNSCRKYSLIPKSLFSR